VHHTYNVYKTLIQLNSFFLLRYYLKLLTVYV